LGANFKLAVENLFKKGYKLEGIDRYSFNRYFSDICLKNKIRLIDLTAGFSGYRLPGEL